MAITRENTAQKYGIDTDLGQVEAINFKPYAGMIISCPAFYQGGDAEVWISSDAPGDGWTKIADITLASSAATVVPSAAFPAHRIKIIAPLVIPGVVYIHMKG